MSNTLANQSQTSNSGNADAASSDFLNADQGRQAPQKTKERGSIAQLLDFAGRRKILTYLGCGLSAFSMLMSFIPYLCIWLVARDLLAVAPNWSAATNIGMYGWIALVFAVVSILFYFAALMCTHLAAFRCASNMRKQTTEHLMNTALGYFDTHASGALRRVVDGCAAETEGLLAHKLPDTAGSIAMILGMLVLFFVFDWRLGIACLVPVAISILCMFYMMGGRGMEFMKSYQDALVRMNQTGTEYVRGIPVVKVFQQTVYSFKAFYDAIQDFSHMAKEYAVTWCRIPQSLSLTVINGAVVFFIPIVLLLLPGETDLGIFIANVAFYSIFIAIIPTAMTRVMFISEAAQVSSDALQRVKTILAAPVMQKAKTCKQPVDSSLSFEKVTFAYEGATRNALEQVSFRVPSGATVALVGPSGGGKSTAAALVPRFWDAAQGVVRVGGVDVRDIDPAVLMDKVAFVFQSNRLFKQSIFENVRASRPNATKEEVRQALHAAQCDDIIEKLPNDIDTVYGAKGVYLSGGEVQRLMLARAILKQADIVVLDEATASLDVENETQVQEALSRLLAGKTVIVIAHRMRTVLNADKIVVLKEGSVVEQGAPEVLLQNEQSLFRRMVSLQNESAQWAV